MPFTEGEIIEGGEKKIRTSVLFVLKLRCLLDIQGQMSNIQFGHMHLEFRREIDLLNWLYFYKTSLFKIPVTSVYL